MKLHLQIALILALLCTFGASSAYAQNKKSDGKLYVRVLTSNSAPLKNAKIAADEIARGNSITRSLSPLGSISGRVFDSSGKPIKNAKVTILNVPSGTNYQSQSLVQTTLTDSEGNYQFTNLIQSPTYMVNISAKGYGTKSFDKIVVTKQQTTNIPNARLSSALLSISGKVLSPDGEPVPDQMLSYSGSANGRNNNFKHTYTKPDGSFEISNLEKGDMGHLVVYSGNSADSYVKTQAGDKNVLLVLKSKLKSLRSTLKIGEPAPEVDWIRWEKHSEKSLKEFRGKVVLLAFVVDAKPSMRMLETLAQIAEKYSDKGLAVVPIAEATNTDIPLPTAKHQITNLPPIAYTKPGLLVGGNSRAFKAYQVKATPTLFLIDRKGVLREVGIEDGFEEKVHRLLDITE